MPVLIPPVPLLVRAVASRFLCWAATGLVRFALWITPEIKARNQSRKPL